ncbi:hypothetical protein AB0F15_16970 [Amycolatopsis sp. NPDC026612]|uniref:hypothetical protein n=1 Tax=Amycolatopsis sp. NPDC026612 TaxID=3155466 RepID=UPI0033E4444A
MHATTRAAEATYPFAHGKGRTAMTTSIDDLRFFHVVAASETLTAAARELA